jgi:flagellar basal body-associated protein FliL
MKLVIIIVLVVVLLAGGGAAFFYLQGQEAETPEDQKTAETETQVKVSADPIYLDVKNLVIPIIRNREIQKYVLFRITLEMRDENTKDEVRAVFPRLKDAFIKDLFDYYAYRSPGAGGINVNAVRRRLKRASDKTVGKGKVKNVLIQGAFERAAQSN